MTHIDVAAITVAPGLPGAQPARQRAALRPDSALAQMAGELLQRHVAHVAAESGSATCARCGQPYPCVPGVRARQVLDAAGLGAPRAAEPPAAPIRATATAGASVGTGPRGRD
ncbi:MAG TPA: hypothetical protein VK453_05950 [Micromonosporaceae bacterium]|nr:hypothetical protein [Micromonosporaceae bacterium]